MLIISQPDTATTQETFVDFSHYLVNDLKETGKFEPIAFKSSLKPIQDALMSGALTQADIVSPMSLESIHKVARLLGIDLVLRVTGKRTKEGIGGTAELERPVDQTHWITVFAQQLQPYKGKGKTPGVGEGIHAQVGAIVNRMTGKLEAATLPGRAGEKKPVQKTAATNATQPTETPEPPKPEAPKTEKTQPARAVEEPDAPARPAGPSPYEAAARRFRSAGDLPNTILALRKAVNDRPRDAGIRRELVQAYIERGWTATARDEAIRAISATPDDPALRRLLGDTYLDQGEAEQALTAFQAAIKLNPKDAGLRIAVGDAYWTLTKADEAQKAYQEAAQVDPKNSLAHRRLARLYVQQNKFKESLAEMNTARDLAQGDDGSRFAEDYGTILTTVESMLTGILGRLQDARKTFASGGKTREQAFAAVSAEKKRADELSAFLEALPAATGYEKVAALYVQAGDGVAQAVEAAMQAIETQDDNKDRQATLLRLEAAKQIAEASKRLKAQLAKK